MNKSESKYFNTAVKMDLALIALLKRKPLAYITVSELCQEAGVNRSTFYLHYETLGDLLDETARYLFDGFFSCFEEDKDGLLCCVPDCEAGDLNFICDKYLIPYFTYIKENKEVFATALANGASFGFEAAYKQLFEQVFDPILERFHYPNEVRAYVMRYYLNGIVAVITEWLRNDCKEPVSKMSGIIQQCIFGLNRNGTEWFSGAGFTRDG